MAGRGDPGASVSVATEEEPRLAQGGTDYANWFRSTLWPELKATFDGNPERVNYFAMKVGIFLRAREDLFQDDAHRVSYVSSRLSGEAANWYMCLYYKRAPELQSLKDFMRALRERFEDPLREERAMAQLRCLRQGKKSVWEYSTEFQAHADKVRDWTEEMKVEYYRAGLNPKLMFKALPRDNPRTVGGWIQLASKTECLQRMMQLRLQQEGGGKKGTGDPQSGEKRRPKKWGPSAAEKERRMRQGLCLKCGADDHFAADCPKRPKARLDKKKSNRGNRGRVDSQRPGEPQVGIFVGKRGSGAATVGKPPRFAVKGANKQDREISVPHGVRAKGSLFVLSL